MGRENRRGHANQRSISLNPRCNRYIITLIKAFEFTHELAWKTLKDFLESRGTVDLFGSKDATREAFATGLIEDGEVWMAMIQNRNQTTHTYNVQTANEIAGAISASYFAQFQRLELRFTELENLSS